MYVNSEREGDMKSFINDWISLKSKYPCVFHDLAQMDNLMNQDSVLFRRRAPHFNNRVRTSTACDTMRNFFARLNLISTRVKMAERARAAPISGVRGPLWPQGCQSWK